MLNKKPKLIKKGSLPEEKKKILIKIEKVIPITLASKRGYTVEERIRCDKCSFYRNPVYRYRGRYRKYVFLCNQCKPEPTGKCVFSIPSAGRGG
jgi:hypothetical protein